MHPDHGDTKKELAHKIPVTDSIQTVLANPGKTELPRDEFSIEHDRRSRQRAGTKRQHIRSCEARAKAICVPLKRFDLGEQIMGEKNRLSALQVRVARHRHPLVLCGQIKHGRLHST